VGIVVSRRPLPLLGAAQHRTRTAVSKYWRPHPAITSIVYLFAIAVPVALVLAVVGSSPTLLDKVPPEYRDTVAAFGDGASRLAGADGGIFGFDDAAAVTTGAGNTTIDGGLPLPLHGDWSARRPEEYPPPAGLTPGVDFAVETTDRGYIAHWPCAHEIPVHSFDAPPGSEGDLIWAVDTLAAASGLWLVYAGPGTTSATPRVRSLCTTAITPRSTTPRSREWEEPRSGRTDWPCAAR